jgi:small subunit ribosomal protein S1
VIELDRNRNRLILSERAALRDWRQSAKQRLLDQLQVGAVCRGVVTSLCDFGAFVDLGGADGLVHLSELSWERVSHPREVLQEGQEVEVYILDVDRDKQRIGLSLRRLMPQPWEAAASQLAVGQIVEATITKIVNFGAFARIADSVEGLIHISELSDARINLPHEVVREGDVVSLKVIRIDPERRRIGLSLKQAREGVDLDWLAELAQSAAETEANEGA